MTLVALLRHAPTDWNRDKRLQGRADIAITASSRAELATRRVPAPYDNWRTLSSPLARCLDTAAALGLVVTPEPRLVEMDWGAYQGQTIDELRQRHGADFGANERRGLDMLPPGGESPRQVQARVAPLLAAIARDGRPTLLVTHRGVIRAVYAAAVGWTMTGDPPHALELYGTLQVFALDANGAPRIEALNVALAHR
ncbi:MAG: histidine phosphatase family protein [Alphaproteobacteria bacterium]|nr:histidine phosphatase family protein [Alphaproteobacteria bacterium]